MSVTATASIGAFAALATSLALESLRSSVWNRPESGAHGLSLGSSQTPAEASSSGFEAALEDCTFAAVERVTNILAVRGEPQCFLPR